MKNYRLGLDMGATSIGWCMLELNEKKQATNILNMGVRIFPDGRDAKSKEPLNKTRRDHRSMRRNRDRFLKRKQYLFDRLISYGFFPQLKAERKQLEKYDPYELRAKALDSEITLAQLGRVIFHLNQRRGFKSNRKLDSAEKDASRMKDAIRELNLKLKEAGARTLGEYLYNLNKDLKRKEQNKRRPIRVRDDGKEYNLYTERSMYEEEYDLIWKVQQKFHPELNEEIKEHLKQIIFFQRPLKPQPKGKCVFENSEPRCAVAYPEYQSYRIYQEVNNLVLLDFDRKEIELTSEQREILIQTLLKQKSSTFKSLRKKLGKEFAVDYLFNLESEKRKDLKGDETSYLLRKSDNFGKEWDTITEENKREIIKRILNDENDAELEAGLKGWLMTNFNLEENNAENLVKLRLPQGVGGVSIKAIHKILPFLKEGSRYHDACQLAGYHHSDFRTGERYNEGDLPYYGEVMPAQVAFGSDDPNDIDEIRYGKIANPTVHIALNQLRKLVNALSQKYGAPTQIVVELARELKLGQKRLAEIEREQTKNKKQNEQIAEELEKLGVENTYNNRLKFKLWEELDKDIFNRRCPYTGKQISLNAVDGLFSKQFEIEHILPKSKTFDDRPGNKTVSYYKANRKKGERSPFEAFGHEKNWDDILARGDKLPKNKRWRFYPDAMKNFEEEGALISRMLTDTQYMSRMAKDYMSYVCGDENVWAIPGKLTAKFRGKWGLNELISENSSKNRADNRHHAIDAFVVACTDRGMLQKVARLNEGYRDRFMENMPEPFEGFDYGIMQRITDGIVVSYKPDHGRAKAALKNRQTVGQLHDETAYGLVEERLETGKLLLWVRKPLITLTTPKKINEIANGRIKEELLELFELEKGKKVETILSEYSQRTGIKRVKILVEKDSKTVIPIKDQNGKPYKYYLSGSNYCAQIYCPDKGKKAGKWQVEIVPTFSAHQPDFEPIWHKENPTAKKIMQLQKDDYVAYEDDGNISIRRVKKMTGNTIYLRNVNIANREKKYEDIGEKFSSLILQKKNARKVGVNIIGQVFDPKRKI